MELDLWGACGEPLSRHLQAAGNPGWGAAENKGRWKPAVPKLACKSFSVI